MKRTNIVRVLPDKEQEQIVSSSKANPCRPTKPSAPKDCQIIFSGRGLWKDFLYWTKMIPQEQSRLNEAGRKTFSKRKLMFRTRSERLKHAFEALAKLIVRILKKKGVGILFIEDLTDTRVVMDFGPRNLLVDNFWAFCMLRKGIEGFSTSRLAMGRNSELTQVVPI